MGETTGSETGSVTLQAVELKDGLKSHAHNLTALVALLFQFLFLFFFSVSVSTFITRG